MKRSGRPSQLRFPDVELGDDAITKSAFARLLKCPPPRVTEWAQRGTITAPALTTAGCIVPSLAVAQLDAAGCFAPRDISSAAIAAVTRDPSVPGVSYDEARTATEVLKAHTALLDLRVRRGELIEANLADGVLFDCLRAVRDAWSVWPARVVADMAVRLGVDAPLLLTELERGVRLHLADLSDPKADWRRRSQAKLGGTPQ